MRKSGRGRRNLLRGRIYSPLPPPLVILTQAGIHPNRRMGSRLRGATNNDLTQLLFPFGMIGSTMCEG